MWHQRPQPEFCGSCSPGSGIPTQLLPSIHQAVECITSPPCRCTIRGCLQSSPDIYPAGGRVDHCKFLAAHMPWRHVFSPCCADCFIICFYLISTPCIIACTLHHIATMLICSNFAINEDGDDYGVFANVVYHSVSFSAWWTCSNKDEFRRHSSNQRYHVLHWGYLASILSKCYHQAKMVWISKSRQIGPLNKGEDEQHFITTVFPP